MCFTFLSFFYVIVARLNVLYGSELEINGFISEWSIFFPLFLQIIIFLNKASY